MINKLKSVLTALLAAALLIAAGGAPARADVMTLDIAFRGEIPQEDGGVTTLPLTGSFRVYQNGIEIGIIHAGETTLTVTGPDRLFVEPMPETIDPAWDLSSAAREVEPTGESLITVSITVRPYAAEAEAAPDQPEAEPENEPESDPAEPAGDEPEDEPASEEPGEAEPDDTEEELPDPQPADSESGKETELVLPTAVPAAEATPEPELTALSEGEDTGSLTVQVFMDGNTNGVYAETENGAPGIQIYVLDQNQQPVAEGKTGADGRVRIGGLPAGEYSFSVTLPENLCFGKKGREGEENHSCMDLWASAVQTSDPVRISAGTDVKRWVAVNKAVSVSGLCWLDVNADGIMDAGEPRVAGAHLTMEGQKNGLSFETWSDANGEWKFTGLRAGFYDLTSFAPEGLMFTRYSKTGGKNRSIFTAEGRTKQTKTMDTNEGRSFAEQNIGFAREGVVTGLCYLDENYNGVWDEGELPMAGVKMVAIKQSKDEEIATQISGEDGRFSLKGLRANTYKIRALLPDDGCDFTVTSDAPLGNRFRNRAGRREDFLFDFTVANGETRELNVGVIYYGSIAGTVYMDDDLSSSRSTGERTEQGIEVILADEAGNVVDTKTTKAQGDFLFSGLHPGVYTLKMTAKEGYAFTRAGEGSVILNLSGGQGESSPIRLSIGQNLTGMDAGMIKPGKVTGTFFADRNDNGLQDPGEGGLSGVTVRLMSEEDEAFRTGIGEDGRYEFDAVMPGRYRLEYDLPENALFAQVVEGGNQIQGENGVGQGEWFDVASADQLTAPLSGALTLGRIAGTVFHDPDASGIREEGENTLGETVLTLIPSRADLNTLEVITGEDGVFTLDGLHPDTYTLHIVMPDGMVISRLSGMELPLQPGQAEMDVSLPIAMGEIHDDQMLGAVRPASLSGRVWLDENNNGRMDEGEQTPAGLKMTVTDELTGSVFAELITDEAGTFGTEGMIPGPFAVSYTLDADSDETQPGDSTFLLSGRNLVMDGIQLGEGESRSNLVMGYIRYTAIEGSCWIERGGAVENLSGATVTLLTENGESSESVTVDETGAFRFAGLTPGRYRLQALLPENCVVVEPGDDRLSGKLVSVMTETDGRSGMSDWIDLRMGQDRTKMNIGSVQPGTIGDFCWLDENGNGLQDGGERCLAGVRIELIRDGEVFAETVTDHNGRYRFENLYPAVYTIRITPPAEIRPTEKRTDLSLIVSVLNETEETVCESDPFQVESAVTNLNLDLGFVLRRAGVIPAEAGSGDQMDWSVTYGAKD